MNPAITGNSTADAILAVAAVLSLASMWPVACLYDRRPRAVTDPETGYVHDPYVCVDCESVRLTMPGDVCGDCMRRRRTPRTSHLTPDPWEMTR